MTKNSVFSSSKRCVECGAEIEDTYEIFCGQFIRLKMCPQCKKIADKYIEYDNVLVYLDLFLQKPPVYRHLLYNHDKAIMAFFVKLFLGSMLLEGYIRQSTVQFPNFYSFLRNIAQAIFEDVIFLIMCIIPIVLIKKTTIEETVVMVSQSFLIGSLGKIFLCLVLMWNDPLPIYFFSVGMSNLAYFVCLSVVLDWKVWKTLVFGSVILAIFTLLTSKFLPITPFTYFVINGNFMEMVLQDLFKLAE
ncbi:protein ARV1, putative [Entamoeba invadens IP1]|uniref:Protein ARV n=1 Tax=Entamoeba invadens IP1 TaxID=370355 RepID=A0A0A1UHE6_ENTIV|nr:protein ARV1, putative [Entamoeba invadens IP1]ELP95187.1 protein ARV1, putative [Entamoeba invadens IP1]|eukprot:XP_004261958.1 protein ARV1, putative [Entamoeba invadens IP1]